MELGVGEGRGEGGVEQSHLTNGLEDLDEEVSLHRTGRVLSFYGTTSNW